MPITTQDAIRRHKRLIALHSLNEQTLIGAASSISQLPFEERALYLNARFIKGKEAFALYMILSKLEEESNNVPSDELKALDYFLIALKSENIDALSQIRRQYRYIKNETATFTIRDQSDLFSQAIVAFLTRRYSKGYYLLKMAASKDDQYAMVELGNILYKGFQNVDKNVDEALDLFVRAQCSQGYSALGLYYDKVSFELSMHYLSSAANQGDIRAISHLLTKKISSENVQMYCAFLSAQDTMITLPQLNALISFNEPWLSGVMAAHYQRLAVLNADSAMDFDNAPTWNAFNSAYHNAILSAPSSRAQICTTLLEEQTDVFIAYLMGDIKTSYFNKELINLAEHIITALSETNKEKSAFLINQMYYTLCMSILDLTRTNSCKPLLRLEFMDYLEKIDLSNLNPTWKPLFKPVLRILSDLYLFVACQKDDMLSEQHLDLIVSLCTHASTNGVPIDDADLVKNLLIILYEYGYGRNDPSSQISSFTQEDLFNVVTLGKNQFYSKEDNFSFGSLDMNVIPLSLTQMEQSALRLDSNLSSETYVEEFGLPSPNHDTTTPLMPQHRKRTTSGVDFFQEPGSPQSPNKMVKKTSHNAPDASTFSSLDCSTMPSASK